MNHKRIIAKRKGKVMPKKYSLSDSDMLGITEAIDKAENGNDLIAKSVIATWNAILGQEGQSYLTVDSIVPGDYAIPTDQMAEIGERIKKRAFALGISYIGVTNIMLEVITNYGPSTYTPTANSGNGTDHILPPPTI